MDLSFRIVRTMEQWERLLDRFPEANFLQSWTWGEFHQKLGHPIYRVSQESVMFQAIVESAKRARYLTVPGGPLVHTWNQARLEPIIDEFIRIARQERCSFVRIRPQIFDSPTSRLTLRAFSFRPAPMHLHAEVTRILDLMKSDDQLLSEMRKNTRYDIRRAQKLGITVEQRDDEKLIDRFVDLQDETARREQFVSFAKNYLLEQFRAFKRNNSVQLFFVREGSDPLRNEASPSQKDQILSMAFVIFYRKEAVYHYAASNAASRTIPAAYAIQWAIIREAKKRGCTRYNLWGDVPDDQLGSHRFSGPSLFKRGFGGQQVSYLHAHDLPLSWKYWVNWSVESVRKTLRRL